MDPRVSQYEVTATLSESPRSRVCRAHRRADGEAVILKILKPQAATEQELARFRREFGLLSRIDVPGVVKAVGLEPYDCGVMLVLEDVGGDSLDRRPEGEPLPVPLFLDLAIGLAGTLAGLHQRRIVHKDLTPAHVLLNAKSGEFRLIGFGRAQELPQLTVPSQPPSALEGDPAYLSPEQTGRMNRPVDYRADFYSLGVVLYESLTGRRPFEAEDALGLVHCHIAVTPRAPHELDPAIPEPLSRIVLKLLAKMAEDRYQSGIGLQTDLERCRRDLLERGTVRAFELGQKDFSEQLQPPRKLYGREEELARMLESFGRAREGRRELLLVAGYAGVGKTALGQELQRPIVESRGYFIEGKFDLMRQNVPYVGWIEAFTELSRALLMESDAQLQRCKGRILDAVGTIGRVLTDVIPDLELVIGPQPEVPALGAAEAQNRLSYVLVKFIQAIATHEHPLVVFLDDLQWIDAASLDLLQTMVGGGGPSHLLVIGAYRNNEVDALHPLSQRLALLREEQASIERVLLQDLSEPTVNTLIAETLRAPPEQTRPLAHLLCAKTGGNPFFLLQTLSALVERQAISLDAQRRCWRWEFSTLQGLEITDNVVDLMLGKIRTLPADTQEVLPLAACLGFRFEAAHLGFIANRSERAALETLQPALREGIATPLGQGFQFAHDRIQQAAYSLIPDAEKRSVHLQIGRTLLERTPPRDHELRLFAIVDHLNAGAGLLETRDEKLQLARLNLRAGAKARDSAAFSSAAQYLRAGVAMLDAESWETDYALALELHTRGAEAASRAGDYESTDRLFAAVTAKARSATDMAGAYESRMNGTISQGRISETLDAALEILARLGLSLPSHPTAGDIRAGMKEVAALYAGRTIESLGALPAMTDARALALARILAAATSPAYLGRPTLCQLFILSAVSASIRCGNAPESPYFYAIYSLFVCGILRDFDTGYRFGKLAMGLLDSASDARFRSRTSQVVYGEVWHCKQHLRATLPFLQAGYRSGLESGDLEFAGYNALYHCCNGFFAGVELGQVERDMASYDESLGRIRAETARRSMGTFWQAVLNLLGQADDPCRLIGKAFDERTAVPLLERAQHATALANLYVSRLMLCYLFGEYERALESAELAAKSRPGIFATIQDYVGLFYDSLARLRLCGRGTPSEQARLLERVSANQQVLGRLADSAPMNHLHRVQLVEAERLRVIGQDMAALDCYDRAIALAREHRFIQDEALANELAAGLWLEKNKEDLARVYLARARERYEAWGAARKVRDLDERYSRLLAGKPEEEVAGTPLERLDLATVMKATRAISSELELDRLLAKVLDLAIQNAGAQSGFLLLERDGQWDVAARGGEEKVELGAMGQDAGEALAMGLVRFVARTRERMVLEDAAEVGAFAGDPHVRRRQVKSLLCAPLLSRRRLVGILYLENNLVTHAFTAERVQFLEMLLAQAAISLENARLLEQERSARAAAEAAQRRSAFLAQAGALLSESLDFQDTLNRLVRLCVGSLADWCIIDLADGEALRRAAGAHADPSKDSLLKELQLKHPPTRHSPRPAATCLRTGKPVLLPEVTDEVLGPTCEDEEHFRIVRALGTRSTLSVPLVARGTAFGSLTLSSGTSGRYGGADVELMEEVARRAAIAIDNARLYREALKLSEAERRKAEAEAANRTKDQFLAMLGHELRNPLAPILTSVQVMRSSRCSDLKRQLGIIERQAGRLAKLVDDLLDVSRISRGKIELRRQRIEISSVIAEAVEAAGPLIQERNHELTVDVPQAGMGVDGDPGRLTQVFANLLTNAAKYTEPHGHVSISARREPGAIAVCVRDDGIGIGPALLPRVFDVFFQDPRALGKAKGGLGMGLALAQRLVTLHGGTIAVESELGKGSAFTVKLPAFAGAQAHSEEASGLWLG
jgi:predicted ATPase/signal transduction histidine kinase